MKRIFLVLLLMAFFNLENFGQSTPEKRADGAVPTSKQRKDRYLGIYRRDVKTTVARDAVGKVIPVEDFGNMANLLAKLPSDSEMRQRYPEFVPPKGLRKFFSNFFPKKRKGSRTRYPEENKNVRISGYIYAVKMMNDNDYHICLLSTPDTSAPGFRVMNVEMAGIRESSPDAGLLDLARIEFAHITGHVTDTKWHIFPKPLHVNVTGALFFDGKKIRKSMMPGNFTPVSAWEVHPIYRVEKID